MEKLQKLRIIKLTQGDFLRVLEGSIRVGIPVLLENVLEALDPALDPILLKQTFKSQGRTLIRLGDTDVDYSDEFKLYITTTLANPHYPPEVCIKVTNVNFTVTFSGLEDQLLAEVASIERPDLEAKKETLVVSIAEGRKTIQQLEDDILRMLAESSGSERRRIPNPGSRIPNPAPRHECRAGSCACAPRMRAATLWHARSQIAACGQRHEGGGMRAVARGRWYEGGGTRAVA